MHAAGLIRVPEGATSRIPRSIDDLEMLSMHLNANADKARRLKIRLYWMWRRGWNYAQLESFGSHVGQPGNRHGVQ
jgi:hypothetical protein